MSSLSSRLASLVSGGDLPEFGESDQYGEDYDQEYYDEEEEVEIIEMTEQEAMELLDSQMDAFAVCRGLFYQTEESTQPSGEEPSALSTSQLQLFQKYGFLIVNNFLEPEVAEALKNQTINLFNEGKLKGANDDSDAKYTDISARSDHILFVHRDDPSIMLDATTNTPSAIGKSIDRLVELQTELHSVVRLRKQTAEYQLGFYASTGTKYDRHRDAFPDNGEEEHQRRVTAIVYANDSWLPEHGGYLRIWPPKRANVNDDDDDDVTNSVDSHEMESMLAELTSGVDDQERSYIDIAPIAGRLVMFLSGCVWHEVRPAYRNRVALTAWCQ